MGLTPLIPNPDDLKRTLGDAPPQVGPGQLRQLQALTAAPPSGGMPSLGGLPPLSGGKDPNLKALDTSALPGLKPIVTSPRQQQEQELQQKISSFENPQKPQGFWQKLGHALSMNPYSMAYRNTQENQRTQELAGLQKQDVTEQDAASKRGLEAEQGREAGARADALEDPKTKEPDLAQAYAHAVQQSLSSGGDPGTDPVVQHLADAITAIQKQPAEKGPKSLEHVSVLGDDNKPMEANFHPDTGQFTDSAGKPIANPRPIPPAAAAGAITVVNPSGQVQRLTPGMTMTPGSMTPTQMGSTYEPTGQEKTAAGRANIVLSELPQVEQEIQANAADLGPVMGQWDKFMQGKVGMDNPKFAHLRSSLMMAATAVAMAHAIGRLPENLREEFNSAINAPKQTAGNLIATLEAMKPWMKDMSTLAQPGVNQGINVGAGAGGGAQAPAVGTVEGGYKFKGGDPAKQENWVKQ